MASSANATAFFDSIIGRNPESYQTQYRASDVTESFHALPRFSHTDDFSKLFSSSPSQQSKYGLSLLFVGCLIVCFFLVWGFLLLLFKCLGRRRVGVFSGHPYAREGCLSTTGRMVHLLSTVLVLIFSVLMVTQGVGDLDFTTDTIDETNQDAVKVRQNMFDISANLQSVSREATPVRDELVDFLEQDVCPLAPNSELEGTVRQYGAATLAAMIELSDFINDELQEVDYALGQAAMANDDIQDGLDSANVTGAISVAILVPYIIVPCFFLVALVLGWCGFYSINFYFFLQWVVLPFFVLMVIFAAGATGFSAATLEATADFCSGGADDTPEGTIQSILMQQGISSDSLYHKLVTFYSNQCDTDEDPWNFLQVYHEQLNVAKDNLDAFTSVIRDATTEQVSQECGIDYGATLQLMNQLQKYTSILLDSSNRSLNLMSCENIVPLYTAAVHNGMCSYAVRGGTWVFSSFFVMAFFGMLMLMFRGAYYPIYYFDFDEKSLGYTSSDEDDRMDADASAVDEQQQHGEGGTEYGSQSYDDVDKSTVMNEAAFGDEGASAEYVGEEDDDDDEESLETREK